jgi:Transcription-repair coupling factor (superfamily II helicase)
LKELENLQVGNYVVHEDKGIGQFDGFQTIKIGDSLHDCIRIKYQDDDILYLQLAHLHKIDKYSSAEGVTPKLSKLGSPEWERCKAKLKKKIKDISRELIKLYAQRKNSEGFAFPADTIWQKEFEASFMFEDTIDQAKASEEVKSDMESISPWIDLCVAMLDLAKPKWLYVPRSKQQLMVSRWHCSFQQRFWHSNII